jgi:hypothetical protein
MGKLDYLVLRGWNGAGKHKASLFCHGEVSWPIPEATLLAAWRR